MQLSHILGLGITPAKPIQIMHFYHKLFQKAMELTSSASIIVGLLLSVIVLIRTRRISKTSCGSNAVFYRIAADHILDEIPISVNVTDDMIDCIDVCVDYPKCIAINSHKRQDSKIDCHLLKDDHMSKRNKLVRKQGWNLYDTGTREISRAVSMAVLQKHALNRYISCYK